VENSTMTGKCKTILSPFPSPLLLWLFFLVALSLNGCAFQEQAPPIVEPAQQRDIPDNREIAKKVEKRPTTDQVMVDDLLSALMQIFPPKDSTIQISAADDNELTLLVANTMAHAGFGMQKVSTDQGASLLTTDKRIEERTNNNLATTDIRIDVGEVSIGRTYSLDNEQTVQPISPFKVYGSRAVIDLGTTLFAKLSARASTQYVAPIVLDERMPLLSLITPDIVQSAANENTNSPELTSINSAKVEVNNLHFGESTFDSVLSNHLLINELTVIFPNDSLTLGNENKLLIRQFMEDSINGLDLVSVIGCSNGPTTAAIGNIGLALGRGERVTDELLSLGFPRDKILDQGCWAPSSGGDYPGRGVVLELWREKG